MQLTSSDWVTIIATTVAFFAGVIVTWAFRERRYTEISWELVSSTPLSDPLRGVKAGKLEMSLDGETVEDVHLLLVRIICSGQLPVEKYRTPVRVAIRENEDKPATLHRAIVTETSSDNVHVDVTERTANAAVLAEVPLNAGEWYTVQLLASQETKHISRSALEVSGSIIGVNAHPMCYYIGPDHNPFEWLIIGIAIVTTVLGLTVSILSRWWSPEFFLGVGLYMFGMSIMTSRGWRRDLGRKVVRMIGRMRGKR